MMKDLLENFFGIHYGSTKKVSVVFELETGYFKINDEKACRDCHERTPECETVCDHAVLKCRSDKIVEVISIETFLDEFNGLKAMPSHSKCDIMLVCDDSIILCDLSCCNPKYFDEYTTSDGTKKLGKMITARHQIEDTITLLVNVPQIKTEILPKKNKIALFASRAKRKEDLSSFDEKVVTNMLAINKIENMISTYGMKAESIYGFVFTEVRYPNVFSI